MSIKKEILLASYWEHFKMAKDLAQIYPVHHIKRLNIEKSLEELRVKLEEFKDGK